MNRKKILFLGGAFSQVPAIQFASDQGHYVITADYLPDNPGHEISHEYHNISTTDKGKILELAKKLNIDAVSAYASDPAAPTAAYVAENLKLVGSSVKSVNILSDKTLFRDFLIKNGFNCPWFYSASRVEDLLVNYTGEKVILKPADSSGSKGIFIVNSENDLKSNFFEAQKFSRTSTVILEQFIEKKGPQIHGEGFVENGKLIFIQLGDQYFSHVNSLVPYSTIVPSLYNQDIIFDAEKIVSEFISKVGFQTGGINIELIRDMNDELYILEIGARNGGNFMPQLLTHATGFDLVKAHIDSIIGEEVQLSTVSKTEEYFAQLILHSNCDGRFKSINIPVPLEDLVIETVLYVNEGDIVRKYKNSKDVVGILILKLNTQKEYNCFLEGLTDFNWVETEK